MNRVPSLLHRPWLLVGSILCVLIAQAPRAEQVSELQVRIVNGATDLLAGSYVELRIYETGGALRKLPLTHGEGWPHDTTRIIPVALEEPLDPRRVERFSLYYSAASTAAPPWQVAAADVDLAAGHVPAHILLAATLSGEIHRQGEIMSRARDTSAMTCLTDAECDDGRSCNGRERCAPQSPSADERGCVRGKPVACPVNQICSEGHGCVGASAFAPKPADLPVEPAPLAGAGAGAVPDAGAAATTSADP